MKDCVYGAMTLVMLGLTVSIIDAHVPNSLWYYIDYVMPF